MTVLLVLICFACYMTAAASVARRLFHHQGPNLKQTTGLAGIALFVHLAVLVVSLFADTTQNMSMTNVASMIACLISASITIALISKANASQVNALLLPVVYGFSALIVGLNALLPNAYTVKIIIAPSLLIHIAFALVAYGCLVITCLYALQVSYINGRLKQKQASLLHSSLPPMMQVEDLLFKLLALGWLLLTLSLLSGFAFLDDMFAKEQAHKTVFSLLAWLTYSILLLGHRQLGWRGKPVTVMNIMGASLLTLAYFGSRFVKEIILN